MINTVDYSISRIIYKQSSHQPKHILQAFFFRICIILHYSYIAVSSVATLRILPSNMQWICHNPQPECHTSHPQSQPTEKASASIIRDTVGWRTPTPKRFSEPLVVTGSAHLASDGSCMNDLNVYSPPQLTPDISSAMQAPIA